MRNNNPIRLKTILFSGFFLTLFAAIAGMTQGYSFGSIFIAGGAVTAGTTVFVGVCRGLQWLGGSSNYRSHNSYDEDVYDDYDVSDSYVDSVSSSYYRSEAEAPAIWLKTTNDHTILNATGMGRRDNKATERLQLAVAGGRA